MTIEHRSFDKLRMRARAQLARDNMRALDTAVVKQLDDFVTGNLVHEMEMMCLGRKGMTVTIEYPADWWQAFKKRWFPGWALERWPVLLQCHKVETHRVCPHLAVPPDAGYGEQIHFMFLENENDYFQGPPNPQTITLER